MIDIENFVETGELLPADLQLQQRQAGGFDGPDAQDDGIEGELPDFGDGPLLVVSDVSFGALPGAAASLDTELAAFRKRLNGTSEVKIAVSDLLTMAACKALKKFPGINVTLKDDQVVTYKSINIGTAVAGDNGLVVPVVKNVQNKNLTDVARESKDLVARAREGRLAPEEYSEGTFSISNLGMFGIGNFTAIINAPESAILSVSSVRKTPVVVTGENGEDAIAIRPMMNIQLSVDHRLIDGLLASQFVEYMKQLRENPVQILR